MWFKQKVKQMCCNCVFYLIHPGMPESKDERPYSIGHCKKKSPSLGKLYQGFDNDTRWPQVTATEVCGDWR